ncbi:hypothetical protein SAICODRAFT_10228 [Saitoella complicata NRRL Y-17804]|nr:uncharacterized protein SAICODRAFT_10228 [Saitoella complicata NRRL Y-17804]ODQ50176.1 hypothetical protein SAICODRAFT_10228 [Saitoella complicata NRRL Y-17804]
MEPLVRWVHALTGECVYGNRAALSWALGVLSLLSWLFAQTPQIYSNYNAPHTTHLAISPLLLLSWTLGDAFNLMGCIFSGQALPFQKSLASWYVLVDAVLCGQWLYGRWFHGYTVIEGVDSSDVEYEEEEGEAVAPDGHKPPNRPGTTRSARSTRSILSVHRLSSVVILAFAVFAGATDSSATTTTLDAPGEDTLAASFAWICTVFYLSSRIPQIIRNTERRSTTGLSPFLFLMALFGNMFYTSSILASPYVAAGGEVRREFLIGELPFLIGSAGCVGFDAWILGQWLVWDKQFKVVLEKRGTRVESSEYRPLMESRSESYGSV